MLSCRTVKAPLIFVSVLMHRETNLQVENEETIEAQSARTPKRCWTESNSAFSFACANFRRWCRREPPRSPRPSQVLQRRLLTGPRSLFVRCCPSLAPVAPIVVRAYPVSVRKTGPLHSAFADRAVGKIGRQFSYKHNAEEGVRLDDKRSTMDRGTSGRGRLSFGVGQASACPGCRRPSCGWHTRLGASRDSVGSRAGHCVRIHCAVRAVVRRCVRMNCRYFDVTPFLHVAQPATAARPSRGRCIPIGRVSRTTAFRRLLHPDDTAGVHRGRRTAVSTDTVAHVRGARAVHRGAAGSRENERRRGMTR